MKLLDTSVAIDHLRGVQPAVDLLTGLVAADELLLASEVVRFELLAGVRAREADALELFFSALARDHRRSHSGIDDADYLIAATTLLLDAELLTTNVRHFPMLGGLRSAY
jgi:predicted nucleic acid-binding protein